MVHVPINQTRAFRSRHTSAERRSRTLRGCDKRKGTRNSTRCESSIGTLARDNQSGGIPIQLNAKLSKQVEIALRNILYARSCHKWHSHWTLKTKPSLSKSIWVQSLCNNRRYLLRKVKAATAGPKSLDWVSCRISVNKHLPHLDPIYSKGN